MRMWIVLSLAGSLILTSAAFASDRDILQKKISKYARTDFGKLRSACVCRESGNQGRAGWLYQAVFTNQI